MKKIYFSFIPVLIFTTCTFAQCECAASGNWSSPATWFSCAGGIPGAGDNVRIDNDYTVTIDVTAVCNNLSLGVFSPLYGKIIFNSGTQLTSAGVTAFGVGPGSFGVVDMSAGGTFISGTWSIGGFPAPHSLIPGTGKVVFTGNFTLPNHAGLDDFYNLEIAAAANTVTLGRDIIVARDLTLTSGTLDASASNFGIMVGRDWTNAAGVFTERSGTVTFNGTATQTITRGAATETFYNLITNTTGPLTLASTTSVTVTNALTMTTGLYNLNGRTLTLGTAAATPGTLNYTAGFMYGGTFKRWFNTPLFAIANAAGHFPMGTSVGDYRPLWVAYSGNLTTGGTVSVIHNPAYPSGTIAATHADPSWAGGTTLQGVSNSTWSVSTANGFTLSGSNGIIRFGGQGFATYNLTDLDASLTAAVVGTYGASTNVNTSLEVNRTALSTANLTNTWRIGTKDIGQSPLPVELISFDAKCLPVPQKGKNNVIQLSWTTASEFNNDFFNIERSTSALNFTPIGKVKGKAGNSSTLRKYEYVDQLKTNDSELGTFYYRLRQTDFNGTSEVFSPVSVSCSGNSGFSVSVNPNPVSNGNIYVSVNGAADANVLVVLTDILGREMYSKIIVEQSDGYLFNINLQDKIAPGVYFVTVSANDKYLSKKLIIQQ